MSVRLTQSNDGGNVYFITFTCYRWKPLFVLTNAYDAAYKWFDYLSGKNASIIGYVIMPNHLHLLVHLPPTLKSPNTVVANAKRFLSYEIIRRLEAGGAEPLLQELHAAVKMREARKGKIHRVFEESFDCKACYSAKFIAQKLTYMHHNPVKGKWNLVADYALYPHSSAGFYHGTGANVYQNLVRVECVGG
ncbi:transposase [Flavisolibacter nicotianae]|uniref:transposase n=1 Tax=Flavisolibacter nicotianae TaxID=2364882 RepID=UPI000EB1E6E0|nr:transposase [Flavisolibacter nicotianae]